jgi:hypothetical protein
MIDQSDLGVELPLEINPSGTTNGIPFISTLNGLYKLTSSLDNLFKTICS